MTPDLTRHNLRARAWRWLLLALAAVWLGAVAFMTWVKLGGPL